MKGSPKLAIIDAVGALAVFAVAPSAPQPYRAILYAFGTYAAYGAFAHATDRITVVMNE